MSPLDAIEAARRAFRRAERSCVSEPDTDREARRRISQERAVRDQLRDRRDVQAVPMTAPTATVRASS